MLNVGQACSLTVFENRCSGGLQTRPTNFIMELASLAKILQFELLEPDQDLFQGDR